MNINSSPWSRLQNSVASRRVHLGQGKNVLYAILRGAIDAGEVETARVPGIPTGYIQGALWHSYDTLWHSYDTLWHFYDALCTFL